MKRNKLFIAGLVTVFVALVSLTLVSSTWAKYTTTKTGSDTAKVAKWEVSVVDKGESSFNFGLFDTINDTLTHSDEEHVADGLIAPGTEGQFTITLNAENEVTTNYTINFTVTKTNASLPIKFSTNGGTTWTDDITEITGTINIDGTTQLAELEKDITVQWMWEIGAEGADNVYGETANEVTVAVNVKFDQVD